MGVENSAGRRGGRSDKGRESGIVSNFPLEGIQGRGVRFEGFNRLTGDGAGRLSEKTEVHRSFGVEYAESASPSELKARELGFATINNGTFDNVKQVFGGVGPSDRPALVLLTRETVGLIDTLRAKGMTFNSTPPKDLAAFYADHDLVNNINFVTASAFESSKTQEHENAHAIIHYINPELQKAITSGNSIRTREIAEMAVSAEWAFVAQLDHEGGAEYAALEAKPYTTRDLMRKNQFLSGQYIIGSGAEVIIDEDWINANFAKLRDILTLRQKVAGEIPWEGTDTDDPIFSKIRSCKKYPQAKYVASYYFFDKAMEHLKSEGATPEQLSQHFVNIVSDPPRTLDELRDPMAYVQKYKKKFR